MEPETVSPLVCYLASPLCEVTGEVYSALAGRFARVFTGLTPGWVAPDPYAVTVDDIAASFDRIRDEDGYAVPASIGDEMGAVVALYRDRG
jgi:hypothetical protein